MIRINPAEYIAHYNLDEKKGVQIQLSALRAIELINEELSKLMLIRPCVK